MKGKIELIGMKFRAFHGCLPCERADGNDFVVDVSFVGDVEEAAKTDSLSHTVDYSSVYDVVAGEMSVPSALLENVAYRIARAIADSFPGVGDVKVSVAKKNPPVDGPVEWSKVSIEL